MIAGRDGYRPAAVSETQVRAPSPALQALEQFAVLEYGALVAASPFLRVAGRGDRHPVLVLPGFTASDRSTAPLRAFLRTHGYWVHGWGLGRNMGPTAAIVDGIEQRLVTLHQRHGVKVSLVGWSLGGIYARELARLHPESVRQVITLGSPFRLRDGDRSSATFLASRLARRFVPISGGRRSPRRRAGTADRSGHEHLHPDRWRRAMARLRRRARARHGRTSRCAGATAASGTTRRCCSRSPTASLNAKASGHPSRASWHLAHLFPRPEWHHGQIPIAA